MTRPRGALRGAAAAAAAARLRAARQPGRGRGRRAGRVAAAAARRRGRDPRPRGLADHAVSRLALDTLRSARVRREAYVGPWLPEPIVARARPGGARDARRGRQPRAAGRARDRCRRPSAPRSSCTTSSATRSTRSRRRSASTAAAARQHASRARKAVEARRPRFPATPEQQRELIVAFGQAAHEGDMDACSSSCTRTSSSPATAAASSPPRASRSRAPTASPARSRRWPRSGATTFEHRRRQRHARRVGDGPDGVATVMSFTVDDGRIIAIDIQRNPEKLRGGCP